ncbi:hypothetical protein ACIPRL_11130 [Streptomyces sp. NPDC090085]|uniref:hypothetical protein n=1 Tax=unclassified Streptomyces TaxID=2593676 RepID=UPI00341D1E6C
MLPLIHLHPGARVFHQDTRCPALPAPVADDQRVTEIEALTDRLAPCGECRPVVYVRHGVERRSYHTYRDCRHLAFTSPDTCDGYAPHSREEAEGPLSLTLCGTCALRATL